MNNRYCVKMVSMFMVMCVYACADQINLVGKRKTWRTELQKAAAHDDERILQTFESLLKLLVAEQGMGLSEGIRLCQQKFAKNNTRVPREISSILPDIDLYIKKLQSQITQEQERSSKTVDVILEMQSSLSDLRSTLVQTINILGSDQKVQVGETNIMACQSLGLRDILCALEEKLNLAIENIQALTTIATETEALSEAVLLNTNTIIYQNNHFSDDIFAPFAAHVYAHDNNIDNVIGDANGQVHEVSSIDDINNTTLNVIEWLKTISAQLVELRNVCITDCVDRYWMNT